MFRTVQRYLEIKKHAEQRVEVISMLTGVVPEKVTDCIAEIRQETAFFDDIRSRLQHHIGYQPSKHDFSFSRDGGSVFFPCITLYALVRLLRVEVVVETGGTPGKSTAAILKALRKNNQGMLYTCDLPLSHHEQERHGEPVTPYVVKPARVCWAVAQELCDRHKIVLGDAKETLPQLIAQVKQIDLFVHDSVHTYEQMMFECKTVWPALKKGGLLLVDGAQSCRAFDEFSKKVGARQYFIGNYGILKKV